MGDTFMINPYYESIQKDLWYIVIGYPEDNDNNTINKFRRDPKTKNPQHKFVAWYYHVVKNANSTKKSWFKLQQAVSQLASKGFNTEYCTIQRQIQAIASPIGGVWHNGVCLHSYLYWKLITLGHLSRVGMRLLHNNMETGIQFKNK